MPWDIKRFPDGYYVVNKETHEKKNKTPYKSEEAAKPYLKALYAHAGTEAMKSN